MRSMNWAIIRKQVKTQLFSPPVWQEDVTDNFISFILTQAHMAALDIAALRNMEIFCIYGTNNKKTVI